MKLKYTINIGSSCNVPTIPNESVHFVVTSPPYGDVKAYARHDPNNIGNYRDERYFNMMKEVYSECFRVLKPGRKLVTNVADITCKSKDGKSSFFRIGEEHIKILESIGFVFQEVIIWSKSRNRAAGKSPPGTLPYPPQPSLLNNWEHCIVCRKPGKVVINAPEECQEASKMDTAFLRDWLYTTWIIKPETNLKWHIAPFPETIVSNFIRLYSFVSENVYDPFGGAFTTMKVARDLNRSCVSTEIGYVLNRSNFTYWLDQVKDRVSWGKQSITGDEIEHVINDLGTGASRELLEAERLQCIKDGIKDAAAETEYDDSIEHHINRAELIEGMTVRPMEDLGPELYYEPVSGNKQLTFDDLVEKK